jgi:hypothetical protein
MGTMIEERKGALIICKMEGLSFFISIALKLIIRA